MGTFDAQDREQVDAVLGVSRDGTRRYGGTAAGVPASVVDDLAVAGQGLVAGERQQLVGGQGGLDEHQRLSRRPAR